MKNILKRVVPLVLSIVLIFSLAGCSSQTEMTEENVTATVNIVRSALMDFDQKKLEKYVDSQTLDTIFKFAKGHDQFAQLGRTIFAQLSMKIESIDLEKQTVTVLVTNREMQYVAADFTNELLSSYSSVQLLTKLTNDNFLNESLGRLQRQINSVEGIKEETITLKIEQGKRNLVLSFDEEAENAVSGGALGAISSITAKQQ